MRRVAIVLAIILAVTTCEAGAKWKEVRKPKEHLSSEIVTRGNLDCSSAIPIAVGQTLWNSNVGADTNVDVYPTCYSGWSEEGGEVVFELTVDGPSCRDIGISLWYRPDICDLDWFLLGSCDESGGDCIEYDDYSWPIDCLDPGTYYLVVDGYEGDECEFVIAVYHNEPVEECSPLLSICHKWDFNVSDQGFIHEACGVSNSVWEWGPAFDIPDTACGGTPVNNVLSTGLSGSYLEDSADAAYVGPVLVGEDCSCLALCHYYEMEEEYRRGNGRRNDRRRHDVEPAHPGAWLRPHRRLGQHVHRTVSVLQLGVVR